MNNRTSYSIDRATIGRYHYFTEGENITMSCLPIMTHLIMCFGAISLAIVVIRARNVRAEIMCPASFVLYFLVDCTTRGHWLPAVLLLSGSLLILAEIFVICGLGLCGLVGVLCMGAALFVGARLSLLSVLCYLLASIGCAFGLVRLVTTHPRWRPFFVLTPDTTERRSR